MMDMSKYVKSKTSNQTRVMPSASQRHAIAQQAKVQLPKTNITSVRSSNGSKQAQSSSMPPPPVPTRFNGEGVSGHEKGDAFELDYDGFEECDESTKGSMVQAHDSQVNSDANALWLQSEQHLVHEAFEYGNEESEHDSEGLVEDDVEEEEEQTSSTQKDLLRLVSGLREHRPEVFTGDVDSYPPTTSGISEGEEDRAPSPDGGFVEHNFTSQRPPAQASLPKPWTNRINRSTAARYSQIQQQQARPNEAGHQNDEALSRHVQFGLGDLPVREIPNYGSGNAPVSKPQDARQSDRPLSEVPTEAMQPPSQHRNKRPTRSSIEQVTNDSNTSAGVLHGGGSSDYDDHILFGMEYNELVTQSFDENPKIDLNAVRQLFPADSALDIPARMKMAQNFEEDAQRLFFSSLTIDQWDEAGDWFLQQFGDVLDRLRHAHRERRKIASQFEDEVHTRHDAVESKKRSISEALSSMRSSGENVLPTPKKPRTARDGSSVE